MDRVVQLQHARIAELGHARVTPPRPRQPQPINTLRGVVVPLVPLVDIEGITLVLITVEIWTNDVQLRAAAVQTSETDRRDAQHEQALRAWIQRNQGQPRPHRPRLEHPPLSPATQWLGDLRPVLNDDVGTDYEVRTRGSGGTGTEWHWDATMRPGTPAEATVLGVQLADGGGTILTDLKLDLVTQLQTPTGW